ncbi:MAG TPA: hypothetical protein DCK93_02790 [Blastocatellia bacterium]|nr:hypothetical protein [Blastocatellia bacterium]
MPCLSGKYNPQIGPLINVGLLIGGTLRPTKPPKGAKGFPALIDTGASGSCIAPAVAQSLGVSPIGMYPMVSATHTVPMNMYLIDIVIPFGGTTFALSGIQVMEFAPPAGSTFQVIIGRDIICRGVLNLGFDGHFSFCL